MEGWRLIQGLCVIAMKSISPTAYRAGPYALLKEKHIQTTAIKDVYEADKSTAQLFVTL